MKNKIIIIIFKEFKSLTSVYSIVFIADKRRFVTFMHCCILFEVRYNAQCVKFKEVIFSHGIK